MRQAFGTLEPCKNIVSDCFNFKVRLDIKSHVGANSSAPWRTAINTSILTQTTLRKANPEIAEVLTAGEDLVGLDDRITSVEERRHALLELHAIKHELDNERVAVLGYKRTAVAEPVELRGLIEIAFGDRAVFESQRREERVSVAVFVDEPLGDDPEYLCPNLADGMYTPVARFVQCLIRRRVNSLVLFMKD